MRIPNWVRIVMIVTVAIPVALRALELMKFGAGSLVEG